MSIIEDERVMLQVQDGVCYVILGTRLSILELCCNFLVVDFFYPAQLSIVLPLNSLIEFKVRLFSELGFVKVDGVDLVGR